MDEVEKVMRTRRWERRRPVASSSRWTDALFEGDRAIAEAAAQVGLCDGKLVFVNRQISGDVPGYDSFSFYDAITFIDSIRTQVGPITGVETAQYLINPIGLVQSLNLTITLGPKEELVIKIRAVPTSSPVTAMGSSSAFISISHQIAHDCGKLVGSLPHSLTNAPLLQ